METNNVIFINRLEYIHNLINKYDNLPEFLLINLLSEFFESYPRNR